MQVKAIALCSLVLLFLGPLPGFSQYIQTDWNERDEWMNVAALMDFLKIAPGDTVADIGCHEGYFTLHLSDKVGNSGKVYAVDVAEYRIDALKEYLKSKKVHNVLPIVGDFDNPKLPVNTLDAIIVMDTYHEMDAHESILLYLKTALKSDGRLLILEKLKAHKRDSDRNDQVSAHTISADYVREELLEAGFEIVEYVADFGDWNYESDKKMWILVAVAVNK